VPQWVLDEAAGRRATAEPWRGWAPQAKATTRRVRRHWAPAGGALTLLVIVALGPLAANLGLAVPGAEDASIQARYPHPTPGYESSDSPLGTPTTFPTGGGTYQFAGRQVDGITPVAYDPCRPIHYVVRPDNEPAVGDRLIDNAVATISQLTGLTFTDDGVTDEAPEDQRQPFQPDRYGDRWAPVLISWDTVAEEADFVTDVAGLGGSLSTSAGNGPLVYVTGAVKLDAAQFIQLLSLPGGETAARAIVLHELGHVVGLAHVDDPTQLMYPAVQPGVYEFAAGDRAGLARLGTGVCEPKL
jgi:hypothetical protein